MQIEEENVELTLRRLLKAYFKLSLVLCSFKSAFDSLDNVFKNSPYKFHQATNFLVAELEANLKDVVAIK